MKIPKKLLSLGLAGMLSLTGSQALSAKDFESTSRYQRLEDRLSKTDFKKNDKRDKYGFIISGETELRHKLNMYLAYTVLLKEGFKKENIFVLDHVGFRNRLYPVDGEATKHNIKQVFEKIKEGLDEKDLFFLYVTNHGDRVKEESTIVLPYRESLTESELESHLRSYNLDKGILVFSQCYSGGFANRLGKGKFVAISSTTKDNYAYGTKFPFSFFYSFMDPDASDTNNDGKISLGEAFTYCLNRGGKVYYSEQNQALPQFKSELEHAKDVTLK